jgi:hypothetical protein
MYIYIYTHIHIYTYMYIYLDADERRVDRLFSLNSSMIGSNALTFPGLELILEPLACEVVYLRLEDGKGFLYVLRKTHKPSSKT